MQSIATSCLSESLRISRNSEGWDGHGLCCRSRFVTCYYCRTHDQPYWCCINVKYIYIAIILNDDVRSFQVYGIKKLKEECVNCPEHLKSFWLIFLLVPQFQHFEGLTCSPQSISLHHLSLSYYIFVCSELNFRNTILM